MALVFGLFDANWLIFKRNFNLYRVIQKHTTPVEADTPPEINPGAFFMKIQYQHHMSIWT